MQLIQSVTHDECFPEIQLPLVGMPIQLRYRVSFLEMYVFPRAGRPTITMTVGGLAKWGAPAAAKGSKLESVYRLQTERASKINKAAARDLFQRHKLLPKAAVYLDLLFNASFGSCARTFSTCSHRSAACLLFPPHCTLTHFCTLGSALNCLISAEMSYFQGTKKVFKRSTSTTTKFLWLPTENVI